MKIIKINTIKHKICNNCNLKESCGDTRGLCMILNYSQIASVIIMLGYFLLTMDL